MKIDKRKLILDSAEKIIMTHSEKDLSVDMIAAEADIAKGGLYYYFKSKDEIIFAVVERAYKKVIDIFIDSLNPEWTAREKIKHLFFSVMKKDFQDNEKNVLHSLNIKENLLINNYMKRIAIQEISPVLDKMLKQGSEEGLFELKTDSLDIAEMIVSVLTFFLDNTIFEREDTMKKLGRFSRVLDITLGADEGTFDFLTVIDDYEG